MLDWLKFFPFEWKVDHKTDDIRGPYFPKLRKNKWCLGDNTLHFKAPWANPIFGFSGDANWVNALLPGRRNILTAEWSRVYGSSDNSPPHQWDRVQFYSNTWKFVGPWFTGFQADLTARALLLTAEEDSIFSGKSLFHPKTFEFAIANFLDKTYGYDKSGRKPHYRGPLNWRVLRISNSIQAVVCDIHSIGNTSKENPTLDRIVFFPISPQQFIRISFDFGGTKIYRDKAKAAPLFQLCDSIIDSLRLQVGAATQAEWDKVKATCPDMSITEAIGEFPWPLKMEKISKGEKEITITPNSVGLKYQLGTEG